MHHLHEVYTMNVKGDFLSVHLHVHSPKLLHRFRWHLVLRVYINSHAMFHSCSYQNNTNLTLHDAEIKYRFFQKPLIT